MPKFVTQWRKKKEEELSSITVFSVIFDQVQNYI